MSEVKRATPRLGESVKEICDSWKQLTAYPRETIVAVFCGLGDVTIDRRTGQLSLSEVLGDVRSNSGISTVRDLTESEEDNFLDAMGMDAIQIVGKRISGVGSGWSADDAGCQQRVYHQAKGNPFPEWLVTDRGVKWLAYCKSR